VIAASYITRARHIALKFDGELFRLYVISAHASAPRCIIRSTHLLRMKPMLSPPGVGSDFRTHRAGSGGAEARGKRLLGSPDPAGAVKRMRVARNAQAAQFAANEAIILRGEKLLSFHCLVGLGI
jgi:hypothetical protein